MKIIQFLTVFSFVILISCESDRNDSNTINEVDAPMTTLPMTSVSFDNLDQFKVDGKNWQNAQSVYADYLTEGSFEVKEGKGILVNLNNDEKAHLYTAFDHGDMELDIEFLMPKGSNSGLYFQGRYEIQLYDSYGIDEPTIVDCGSIYERWDDSKPEDKAGYEGHPPLVNASKAPGLWQHLQVYFRAPKFDSSGNKIKNAIFENVYLNGIMIHNNVEVTGPTRAAVFENEKEVPFAPMVIQGDHGKIAFRNMKYKSYTQDSLSISNLTYKYYEYEADVLPDFDTLTPIKEGTSEYFDVNVANEKEDKYALLFSGDLNVPVTGTYLFHTGIDDGADLFIDNKIVVHNDGDPGYDNAYNTVELTEGKHDIKLSFYDNTWQALIRVNYEGPGIYSHALGGKIQNAKPQKKTPPILMEDVAETELLRSFIYYKGAKRTHVISVADPGGLNYSYDLSEGSLLKFWRGGFGDLTDMWEQRGEPQIIKPLNASIEAFSGLPIAKLNNKDAPWPAFILNEFKFKGYELNSSGQPTFSFSSKDVNWTDFVKPDNNSKKLTRTITFESSIPNIFLRVAQAETIEKLPNGLYSIGGQYYLQIDEKYNPIIREKNGNFDMIAEVKDQSNVIYSLLW